MKLITTLFVLLAFTIFPKISQAQQVELPAQPDWQYQGVVIRPGNTGTWDVRLSGMITPCAVVKKDDTYFLYYLGADGNRTEAYNNDGGPRHRALGIALAKCKQCLKILKLNG